MIKITLDLLSCIIIWFLITSAEKLVNNIFPDIFVEIICREDYHWEKTSRYWAEKNSIILWRSFVKVEVEESGDKEWDEDQEVGDESEIGQKL